ncbi:hypothetical protein EK21DRAFT_109282 [Setomelanomma holmii]|uniref:Heterokaryon incompatibility domain-containing protein n=1 Tax=Setomelanomma holmii TaxID=210430 RepID=A0A9P4HE55_9PLEO|nr:hypothetical protein EK21DRAFT_109282 [Setomelanomma holmii]
MAPAYFAVSWKWSSRNECAPSGASIQESFEYYIRRPGGSQHRSSFPDRYMDRVILLAQSFGINRIWVDRECIYQEEAHDKELGVQVMDLVYETATKAVGLLTSPLMHQDEIDTLAQLLRGDMLGDGDDGCPELKSWVDGPKQAIVGGIISDLQSFWTNCGLVDLIQQSLDIDRDPRARGKDNAVSQVVLKMFAALVDALAECHDLYLARLQSETEDSPPFTIFIAPHGGQHWGTHFHNSPESPVFVFTSWENRRTSPNQERLASIEVIEVDGSASLLEGKRDGQSYLLKDIGWVHGVWDARKTLMTTCVFPFMNHGHHTRYEKQDEGVQGSEVHKPVSGDMNSAGQMRKRASSLHDEGS